MILSINKYYYKSQITIRVMTMAKISLIVFGNHRFGMYLVLQNTLSYLC